MTSGTLNSLTLAMRSLTFPTMSVRSVEIALIALALAASGGCSPTKSEAELAAEAISHGLEAHQAGRLEEASLAYREVLVHDPTNKFAFYNLGLIDQTLGRAEPAEANYRLALSADPIFAPALYNLAILRAEAGATQEAIDLYRRVLELEPDNARAYLNLGFALLEAGQDEEAQRNFQLAIELDPGLGQRVPQPVTEPPISSPTP